MARAFCKNRILPTICLLNNDASEEDLQAYIDGFHPNQLYYTDCRYPWPRKFTICGYGQSPTTGEFYVHVRDYRGCLYSGTGSSLEGAAIETILGRAIWDYCETPNCRFHLKNS